MTTTCNPAPSLVAFRAEATRIYPAREQASDGICPDAHHIAQGSSSDHNINPLTGYNEALDIDQDTGFNVHRRMDLIAHLMVLPDNIGALFRALIKYMVAWDYAARQDKIISTARLSEGWRLQNSWEHLSHGHTSINSTVFANHYTGPFWGLSLPPPVAIEGEEMIIFAPNKPDTAQGRVPFAFLDKTNKKILLFNGAAISGDLAVGGHREKKIVSNLPVLGWAPTRDPKTLREDNQGVEVGALDGGAFKYFWS